MATQPPSAAMPLDTHERHYRATSGLAAVRDMLLETTPGAVAPGDLSNLLDLIHAELVKTGPGERLYRGAHTGQD